jgi:hypothetical protein
MPKSELIMNKAFRYDLVAMLHTQEIEFQILYDEFLGIQKYLLTKSNENQQSKVKNNADGSVLALRSSTPTSSEESTTPTGANAHDYLMNGDDHDAPNYEEIKNQRNKLDAENAKLKKQMRDLSNKVKFLQLQISNQDELCCKLQHDNKQLQCQVDTLEIERSVLLKNKKK